MYQQAIGFNPSSVLSGLTKKASPYGTGLAMQAGSQLRLEQEKKNQDFGVDQMQAQSQQRQQAARTSAQHAANSMQERSQASDLAARAGAFEIGKQYDYAALQRRPYMQLQQMLINNAARDF